MRTFPLIACSCMTQQMHKWYFLLARLDDLVSEWCASVSMTAVESRTNAVLMAAQEDRKQATPQKQTSVWSVSKRGVRCPSRWSRHADIRCLHLSLQTLFIHFTFQPQFGQKRTSVCEKRQCTLLIVKSVLISFIFIQDLSHLHCSSACIRNLSLSYRDPLPTLNSHWRF